MSLDGTFLGSVLADVDDTAADALRELTETETPEAEDLDLAALVDNTDEEDEQYRSLAYRLYGVLMADPVASRIVAYRFSGWGLTALADFIANMRARGHLLNAEENQPLYDHALSARDAAEFLAVALSEIPPLSHLAADPPPGLEKLELENATPSVFDAFPDLAGNRLNCLIYFFGRWASIPTNYLRIVQNRRDGRTLKQIGQLMGITLQAAHWSLKNTISKNVPEVPETFFIRPPAWAKENDGPKPDETQSDNPFWNPDHATPQHRA